MKVATFTEKGSICIAICTKGKKVDKQCSYKASAGLFCKHHRFITESDIVPEKAEYGSCRVYRVRKLEKDHITQLKKWFGVARKYYNATIAYLKENKLKGDIRTIIEDQFKGIDYCDAVPSKIKQEAIADAKKAVSNSIKKYKKSGECSRHQYRSKRNLSQSININRDALGTTDTKFELKMYPRIFPTTLKFSEEVQVLTSCRLVMKYNRTFYLHSPQPLPRFENQETGRAVAVDPGIRNFISFFSNEVCGRIGSDTRETKLYTLVQEMDRLQSKTKRLKSKKPRISRKLHRMWTLLSCKLRHLVSDLHWKAASFLCQNFDHIILPLYSSKGISKKAGKMVNRFNAILSHFTFRQRLHHKARQYGREVIMVNESYTSKTCTRCGHENSAGRDFFTCQQCRLHIDRDYQGARNILLKTFTQVSL